MSGFLVRWTLKFRLLVLAAAAGILGMGLVTLPSMPVDNLPEFAPPHVEIQTEALGLSAVEVEQLITSPMEADLLNGVAWLDEIRSVSVPGLSSIEMIFEPGTDILRARQLVAERLTQAFALPNVSTAPVLMQPLSSNSRVMMVQLSSAEQSVIDMSVLARWNIKPVLMGVPGVANVSIWGQREQQLQVHVDPERLRAQDVTLNQVIETTGNAVWVSPLSFLEASTPGTGGFLESANQRIGIQHVLPIQNAEDLGKVSVEGTGEKPLQLSDVAELREDHQPLIGDAVTGDAPGLILVVEKFPDADVVDVTKHLEEALDELRPGLPGIEVDSTIFRPASYLESAASQLGLALLIGLLVVTIGIGLAFRSWRYALIGLAAIVLSAVAAALILQWQGAVLNTMAFAGIVLALIVGVGDVIADLHSVRHRDNGGPARTLVPAAAPHAAREAATGTPPGYHSNSQPAEATASDGGESLLARALRRSRMPMIFAALATLLALAPALFVRGVDGALLRPLILSYLLAVAVGFIVAHTVTPALASILLPAREETRPVPAAVQKVRRRLDHLLASAAEGRRWLAAGVVAILGIAALAAIPLIAAGNPMVASVPDRTLLIQWDAAPGTANTEMNRITARASDELRTLDGVAAVGGHVGRAITSDTEANVSSSEIWVTLEDGASFERVKADVQGIVDGYPGLANRVLTYPEGQVDRVRQANEQGFQVRVYGIELPILREKAEELQQVMAGIDGVANPRLDIAVEQPIAEIEVDLDAAERVGIKPGDVRRAAAAILQGIEVGFIFEQQKVFQVIVKGDEATRGSLTSVRELTIDTPDGGSVQLGDVADVRISPNQTVIHHDDTSRRIDVLAEIEGRSLGDVQSEIRAAIAEMEFPVEYHAEIPPQYEEQQVSARLIWWLAAAAAVGILILLQTVLGSWRLAGLVLLALPVALSGGVLATLLTGGDGSLYALMGLAAVLGFAIREALQLVGHFQTLQSGDPSRRPVELMRQAVGDRLLPMLLAAGIAALALVPLVALGGTVGAVTLLPLAVVLWGGLVTTALLVLWVLPVLVLTLGSSGRPDWSNSLVNMHESVLQRRQEMS